MSSFNYLHNWSREVLKTQILVYPLFTSKKSFIVLLIVTIIPCPKFIFFQPQNQKKVLGGKRRVKNDWISGQTYRKIEERQRLKGKVCPPEGESHCCICIEGQGGESQRPGRQAEKPEQFSRRS